MQTRYLDSSAIVKLVVAEPESAGLRRHLRRRRPLVSSALARTEVLRAVLPHGEPGLQRARTVLERIDLIRVNDRVLSDAGLIKPPEVRSLDALHLATASMLGEDLGAVVTYDTKMADAARSLGMVVEAPS